MHQVFSKSCEGEIKFLWSNWKNITLIFPKSSSLNPEKRILLFWAVSFTQSEAGKDWLPEQEKSTGINLFQYVFYLQCTNKLQIIAKGQRSRDYTHVCTLIQTWLSEASAHSIRKWEERMTGSLGRELPEWWFEYFVPRQWCSLGRLWGTVALLEELWPGGRRWGHSQFALSVYCMSETWALRFFCQYPVPMPICCHTSTWWQWWNKLQ